MRLGSMLRELDYSDSGETLRAVSDRCVVNADSLAHGEAFKVEDDWYVCGNGHEAIIPDAVADGKVQVASGLPLGSFPAAARLVSTGRRIYRNFGLS
jgi:hypothetical protein